MTIKHASFHEREDNVRKPKRPKHRDDRNLRNALRSNDVDALLELTDDSFNESPEEITWK